MSVTWVLVGLGSAALGFAFLFGGREERIYATAKATAALGELVIGTHSWSGTAARDALTELALFAVVLPLALKSTKVWPLAAASLCLATLMTAAAQMLIHASPPAYGIARGGWQLLAYLVIVVGAWSAWRARRRGDGRARRRPTDPA